MEPDSNHIACDVIEQPDLNWINGSVVEQVEYDEPTGSWCFSISGRINLCVYCRWQLISGVKKSLASRDHGQRYGLGETINAAVKATEFLTTRKIVNVIYDKLTADLTISLEGDVALRTFNDSCGFEGWQLVGPQGINFVAMGDGKIMNCSPKKKL